MQAGHDTTIRRILSTKFKLVGGMRVKGRKGCQFVKRTEMERQMWCDKLCATVRWHQLFLCHVLGGGSEMEVTLGGQIACDQLRLLSGCRLVRSPGTRDGTMTPS